MGDSNDKEELFNCRLCRLKFNNQRALYEHVARIHGGKGGLFNSSLFTDTSLDKSEDYLYSEDDDDDNDGVNNDDDDDDLRSNYKNDSFKKFSKLAVNNNSFKRKSSNFPSDH